MSALVYPNYALNPDEDWNGEGGILQEQFFYMGVVAGITQRLYPALLAPTVERCAKVAERLGLQEAWPPLLKAGSDAWNMERDEIIRSIEDQMFGPPWADCGTVRSFTWKVRGILWNISWNNDLETTAAAEEFIAALQVILCDTFETDMVLIEAEVRLYLAVARDDPGEVNQARRFDAVFEPLSSTRTGHVTLPSFSSIESGRISIREVQAGLLTIAWTVLEQVSLLPRERFVSPFQERFDAGLDHKLQTGSGYRQLFHLFVSQKEFDNSARTLYPRPDYAEHFACKLEDHLPIAPGSSPSYEADEASRDVKRRYERFIPPIRITLERLRRSPEFQGTVALLRHEGWKDWHILGCIFNISLSYRMNQRLVVLSPDAEIELMSRLAHEEESPDSTPIPLEEFSEARIRTVLPVYIATFAKTSGLELHSPTLDLEALQKTLSEKFNFWNEDVEHEDPFKLTTGDSKESDNMPE